MNKLQFIFDPIKEADITEETRLVIQDWKKGEFHTLKVLDTGETLRLDESDFESHLYYRYKFQIKRNGKWEDKTRYKNLPERETEEGIKYLYYHHANSPALIVVFQALASVPGYNYVRTLKDLPVSKLYIKDEYGPNPTKASYYLGKNKEFNIAANTAKLIEYVRGYNNIPKEKVICAGSSKGGFASIYQAFFNDYGYAVAGGPQIYLGNYLGKGLGKPQSVLAPIYTFITGSSSESEIEWANAILTEVVKNRTTSPPNLYIHVGKNEPHYKNHVLPFYEFLNDQGIRNVELDLGEYDDHDELAMHFPVFLKEKIESILKNMVSDEIKLFKRTEPNDSTLEIADMILNNHIYLFKTWEPFKFDGELNWEEDPFNDKTWKFYLHEIRMVSFLSNAYEITKNMKYLIKARWFIESWMKKNPSANQNVSEWSWTGHGTANRLLNLIYFWSLYKESQEFDNNFRLKFIDLLIEHGLFLENDEHYEDYNHGIFQDQALLELAILFPDMKESGVWLDKSIRRLTNRINKDFSESGVHKEHSPAYHLLVMKLFQSIKSFMDHYKVKYPADFKDKFTLMQDYMAVLVDDQGNFPLLGDTGVSKVIRSIKAEDIASDYWLYKYSNGKRGKPLVDSFFPYPDGGIAIYKGNKQNANEIVNWVFTAAFHSTVHKHADDLSFLLKFGKTNYFVDSGRYNYREKDPFRKYFRSVFAHNSIAVDEKTYSLTRDQKGRSQITDYGSNEKYTYVRGTHKLYEGITITRLLLQLNDGALIIHDKIDSKHHHKYSQLFNIGQDVKVNTSDSGETFVFESQLENSFITMKQLLIPDKVEQYEGNENPIRGWQSFEFNEKHPIKSVHFSREGQNVEFLTLINFSTLKSTDRVEVGKKDSNTVYKIINNNEDQFDIYIKDCINSIIDKSKNKKVETDKMSAVKIKIFNQHDLVPVGTKVKASIESSHGEDLTYAWYVYRDGRRVDVRPYSPELKNITISLDQEGIYYLKGFVKDKQGNKSSKNSTTIKAYKTSNNVPKRKVLTLYNRQEISSEYLDHLSLDFKEPAILTVNKNHIKYDFLLRTDKESPFLFVLGSGAYNSKEFAPPVFQRHSWVNEFKGNVIYYNDPTLYLRDINLGWGQGTKEEYYLENIAEIIAELASKMRIENNKILFYGSSAGGFMSLMLAGYLNGSSAFVNNPQTIVPNYFKSHVQAMYEASYPDLNVNEIISKFNKRLDVTAYYQSIKSIPNIYYLQNAACQHDMENHFEPFLRKIHALLQEEGSGQLVTNLYWDEDSQHNPVSKELTLRYLDIVTDLFLK